MIPVITVTGLQLGAIIYAVITETVFNGPGVGLLFINAVQFVDIPVMAAYLMLISVMFVMINLLVDILYVWVVTFMSTGDAMSDLPSRRGRKQRSSGTGGGHQRALPLARSGMRTLTDLFVPPVAGGVVAAVVTLIVVLSAVVYRDDEPI
jgi:ABC-type nitrate/sulfonate/bicarbonate transport system permease component